ncbi:MAG TPA: diguanylate cyclase [Anaerolineales bacterium]|nr:diguanylate cyclase [Anaerolineales bacterium]
MDKRRQLASDSGLYTYETFEILLNHEIARVKRYSGTLTLIHLALATENLTPDFVKQAHAAMTNLLDRTLRISDVPAHYKDDFMILLPSADNDAARAVAERILGQFRTTQSFTTGKLSSKRNAYLGVTTQNGNDITSDGQILAEATIAMNEARQRQSYTFVSFADISSGLHKPY